MEQSFDVLEYLRQEAAALGAGGLNNSSVSVSLSFGENNFFFIFFALGFRNESGTTNNYRRTTAVIKVTCNPFLSGLIIYLFTSRM